MKVWVIWDGLYERPIGVYSSEEQADRVWEQLEEHRRYDHSVSEYEIDAEPRSE